MTKRASTTVRFETRTTIARPIDDVFGRSRELSFTAQHDASSAAHAVPRSDTRLPPPNPRTPSHVRARAQRAAKALL